MDLRIGARLALLHVAALLGTADAAAAQAAPRRPAIAPPVAVPMPADAEPCAVSTAWASYFQPETRDFLMASDVLDQLTLRAVREARGGPSFTSSDIVIPVVFHVVLKPAKPEDLVPRVVVETQLAMLNHDFDSELDEGELLDELGIADCYARRVAAPPGLRFVLARRNAACESRDGIVYAASPRASWDLKTDKQALRTALAACSPPWDPSRFLNVWVVDAATDCVGVASYPIDPPNLQGVIVDRLAFGDAKPPQWPGIVLRANRDRGRTLTHEVGHWLGLIHPWGPRERSVCGNAPGACLDGDGVLDTPQQCMRYMQCSPSADSCKHPGYDLCYDFMDYAYDSQRLLFTAGQVVVMRSSLGQFFDSLLTTSGHIPALPSADPWISDGWDDVGDEMPGARSEPPWTSFDLWVRSQPDGRTFAGHQSPPDRSPLYLNARVRNRGCVPTASTELSIYRARPGDPLEWPWPGPPLAEPDPVARVPVPSIAAGESWSLADYSLPAVTAPASEHSGQVTLLAVLGAAPAPTTTRSLMVQAKEHNDIAIQSVWVVDPWRDASPSVTLWFSNPAATPRSIWLSTRGKWRESLTSFTDIASVRVEPDPELLNCLAAPRSETGLRLVGGPGGGTWELTDASSRLGPFVLPPGQSLPLRVFLAPLPDLSDPRLRAARPSRGDFVLELRQTTTESGGDEDLVSGGLVALTIECVDVAPGPP